MTGCPSYLFTGDIAKQLWCQFESVIRCRENEDSARLKVEEIKKRSGGGDYYELPVLEKSFFVIPKLKALVPLTAQRQTAAADDDWEKIYNFDTGETLFFLRLEPELFKKHFGAFKGPVKIAYSDWRRLSGRRSKPCETGDREEDEFSEKYPTAGAFREWEGICVAGTPDGLAAGFVYVFTTVENYYYLKFVKPVAFAEAELYAFLFNRPGIRVQVRVRQANKIETFEHKSNSEKAVKLLAAVKGLLEGAVAPVPPGAGWKCKNCAFRSKCPGVSPA